MHITKTVVTYLFFPTFFFSPLVFLDDDDRDIQADRAVDYGKRHQAIDILWMGTILFVDFLQQPTVFFLGKVISTWISLGFLGWTLNIMDFFEGQIAAS